MGSFRKTTQFKDWSIGDFMITQKFLDFSFIKSNKHRYYDLSNQINIKNKKLHYGTYTYTIGPTYETKTEIEEIKFLGGDVVGMSTFPEYMMCNNLKINPEIWQFKLPLDSIFACFLELKAVTSFLKWTRNSSGLSVAKIFFAFPS